MSQISQAIVAANGDGRMALAAYVTAGFPNKEVFESILSDLCAGVDVLEIGVPFSDPMADGISIQDASFEALRQGITLEWIFETVARLQTDTPVLLMSYLNPLLAYGFPRLVTSSVSTGVAGFIVPDLPIEEAAPLAEPLGAANIDLVQLVTPATPEPRMQRICRYSRGFVYAVTSTGTTGGNVGGNDSLTTYLDRVRSSADIPVMAGFGIRAPDHIRSIAGHADGVVVGSAIVEALAAGQNVVGLIRTLRDATSVHKEVSS